MSSTFRYKNQCLICDSSFEPGHEKMCLMPYANNKGTDINLLHLITIYLHAYELSLSTI